MLIVVAVATMAVYSFTELMLAYDDSAYLAGDLVQARVNVESATESLRLILSQPPETRADFGGLYNNPQLFQAVRVSGGADGAPPSNFSILAPDLTDTGTLGGIRFGLQNESARLNVNALVVLEENGGGLVAAVAAVSGEEASDGLQSDNIAISLLMTLPGMTEDVAEAILDWIDEDDEPRPFGAESDYYQALPTPYASKNGPLNSVEELLLVRGVSPSLLFGADVNRNGVVDADEQQRSGASINTSGALGWAAYLTVHGSEANKRRNGEPRIDVNQDDLEALYSELLDAVGDETFASFIVAYRIAGKSTSLTSLTSEVAAAAGQEDQGGNRDSNQDESGEPDGPWSVDFLDQMDLTGGGGTSLNQILDLVDATVTVGEGDQAKTYTSPFTSDPISASTSMPILMDALSTQDVDSMPGRINLNECPAELLYGIPLLSEEAVQGILDARQSESDDPNRFYESWLMVEGILTLDELRRVTPLLTCGGDVYRAQVVGYFEGSGAAARVEVIIDATTVNPKIISSRSLSHLGRGFDQSVLGLRDAAEIN